MLALYAFVLQNVKHHFAGTRLDVLGSRDGPPE